MNSFMLRNIAILVGLSCSAGAMAQALTHADYLARKDKISVEYHAAKANCDALSDNANDICMADAKGRDKVALAELEASYRPGVRNQYNTGVARAEADYAVARERCDDKSGNVKDVCVKAAKAAEVSAKADAKAQMKTSAANATAREKTFAARSQADEATAEARRDAQADKLDADYTVARERCDTYAGGARDHCLDQAKIRFGKS